MMKRAFSLIEVMVSLVILLVGIMGMAVAFQRNIYQTNASKNDSQALMIASAVLDELEAIPFDSVPDAINDGLVKDKYLYDYQGNVVASEDAAYYVPEIEILDSTANYISVQIAVNWTGWSGELAQGGFGAGTPTNAFTMVASITQQYGDDLLAGTLGSGGGGEGP